jgi:alkaline phosphatase D
MLTMLTRRQFVRAGAAAAATVLVPPMAAAKPRRGPGLVTDARFPQGVLSGDPSPTSATVLTLLGDVQGEGKVRLEVASDEHFRHVVATRDIPTSRAVHWSVKARVHGLEPHTRYWYRFETRRSHSPAGRLQTALPPDSRQPVHFAVFSCADYTHGFYNAYDAMADEDLDFVVCLGDYVYSEVYNTVAGGTGVRDDHTGRHNPHRKTIARTAQTLSDYRAKYALYRSDSALRRMHERFPMIAVWDDHEIQDNYAGGAPDGGRPLGQRYSLARQDAAYRAWFEAMPTFPGRHSRIYRSAKMGRSLELIMLDERQYRAKQPCHNRREAACASWDRPRTMLGAKQFEFVRSRLLSSPATWRLVGTPSMTMPLMFAGQAFDRFDAWQGYPQQREALLASARPGTVFLAGDAHTFFAGDVRTQMGSGPSVAIEFVTGSITSRGFGESTTDFGAGVVLAGNDAAPATPAPVLEAFKGFNPWLHQLDLDHHGYLRIGASRKSLDVTMRRVATIKRRDSALLPIEGYRWIIPAGATSLPGPV